MAKVRPDGDRDSAARSQTLHRGLVVLEMVSEATSPMSLPQIVDASGWHRSIVYRLLRTLEDHALVERGPDDLYRPGLALMVLSRGVSQDISTLAAAELTRLANETRMTAFVVVRDGSEAVTILSVAPTTTAAHVSYLPGSRHPLDRGAPGLALLIAEPARPGERSEVAEGRKRGWAVSHGEVIAGLSAVAAPTPHLHPRGAAVSVVFAGDADVDQIGSHVAATAARLDGHAAARQSHQVPPHTPAADA